MVKNTKTPSSGYCTIEKDSVQKQSSSDSGNCMVSWMGRNQGNPLLVCSFIKVDGLADDINVSNSLFPPKVVEPSIPTFILIFNVNYDRVFHFIETFKLNK